VIPADAVEAAAKAIFGVDDATWDLQIQDVRDSYLEDAKNALEAATPYIRAQVATAEELDALWLGSVVLSQGVSYQRYGTNEWAAEGAWYETGQVELPATILHDPRTYRV